MIILSRGQILVAACLPLLLACCLPAVAALFQLVIAGWIGAVHDLDAHRIILDCQWDLPQLNHLHCKKFEAVPIGV